MNDSSSTAATVAEVAPAAGFDRDSVPRVGHGFRLQWETVQQAHVLLYPEGMVKLNGSAGEILARCDGVRSVAGIVADLEQLFTQSGLEGEVIAFLDLARVHKWVESA